MTKETRMLMDENATAHLALALLKEIKPGDVIFLSGELGSGKTTFTRALLRAMGYTQTVKSPTYTLVETYALSGFEVHHFDLYRVHEDELLTLGLADYFDTKAVVLVEWPEKGGKTLPPPTYHLHFFHEGATKRRVLLEKL